MSGKKKGDDRVSHVVTRYHYSRTDEQGRAVLEDEGGNDIRVPAAWLPRETAPGASFNLVHVTGYVISSLSMEIDLDSELPD